MRLVFTLGTWLPGPLAIALLVGGARMARADADQKPWTLEAFVAAAEEADPEVLSAVADLQRLRGVEAGVSSERRPSLDWNLSFSGPTPEARNDPAALDSVPPASRLGNGVMGSWSVWTHLDVNLAWPIYTFGRSEAAGAAAKLDVSAARVGTRAARARAARRAAEVYWDYQVARRGVVGLEETDRQFSSARERTERLLATGSTQVSKKDLAQIDVARALCATYRARAVAARDLALEMGRTLVGLQPDAPFAFASAPLDPTPVQLPSLPRSIETALAQRPELMAARDRLRAREAAARAKRRGWYPELVATGDLELNSTPSRTTQTNPFAWDPHNRETVSVGLALRGRIDPWRLSAESVEGDAEVAMVRAEVERITRALRFDVARAHSTLRSAQERMARAKDLEAAARRWLALAEASFEERRVNVESVLIAAVAVARISAMRNETGRDAHLAQEDLRVAMGVDLRGANNRK